MALSAKLPFQLVVDSLRVRLHAALTVVSFYSHQSQMVFPLLYCVDSRVLAAQLPFLLR